MARYIGPVCRLCRRENQKLFLKGDRCFGEQCSFDRRGYPPGEHGQGRMKFSEYALQLRAKQKVKRIYGLTERQFRITFKKAAAKKGVTGENLLSFLERRLDNAIYRMGYAASRSQARQLVRHGHFTVNGQKVNIPAFQVRKGDQVKVTQKSQKTTPIQGALESAKRREMPQWVEVDHDQFLGTVRDLPSRDDISVPVEERLIVELYSK
jgi:small subunit ribosomal protein S4